MLPDCQDTDVELFLARLLGSDRLTVDDATDLRRDLHLDSVARLELLAWLAAHGVAIDELPVEAPGTVADVRRLLRAAGADGAPPVQIPHSAGAPARPVVLRNGRFALRPVTTDYVPFLYEMAISEQVGFRWRFRGAVPNQETFTSGLWQGVLVQFVVVLVATGEPVGLVVVYNADTTRGLAYLAAVFTPPHILTGLPASAVELFVRYIFQVWNFRKLYLEMPAFNYELIASGAGVRFDVEGCLKDYSYYDGRFWDEYLLAICRHHVPPVGAQLPPPAGERAAG